MASTSTHTVSSSSNPNPKWNYDVFLSFRGEDTRKNFVDHLFAALSQKGIYTFKDDEQLKRGEEISPALLKAIEESRFALVVFSKNYASSKWCLDELVKIAECRKTMGQTVVPVFYDVDPSEVRKQTGSYGSAFEIHEKVFSGNMERVQRWKTALVEAANISGYSVPDTANGTMEEWKSTLIKLHKIPNKEILRVLKISFDGLDEMEKEIFLDIACFFKGKHKCYVTRILDSCGFCPGIGIPVLVEKSLITITNDHFCMHDLIQEMGWYIVCQESQESRKRSRLWLREDVCCVLTENTGKEKIEAIVLELSEPEVVDLSSEAFTKMRKLRLFKVHNVVFSKGPAHLPNELRWLDWHAYPSGCLPPSFQAQNLVELSMCYSSIKQLWKINKPLTKLKVMNLSHSHRLSRTPDFTVVPNLDTLILEDCTSLVEVHPSIGVLKRLVFLSIKDCKNLKRFSNGIHLESLQTFILSGCLKLENCPEILGDMVCLSELYLDRTAIKELPSSIEHLTSLTLMDLSECKYLTSLPRTICRLSCLKTLTLSGCSKLEELPEDLGNIKSLEEFHASKTAIKQLPSSINHLEGLKVLSLSGCKGTISQSFFSSWFLPRKREDSMCLVLPSLTGLYSLTELDLSDCNLSQEGIPSDLGSLSSLKELNLSRNNFVSLPATISHLSQLESLELVGCKRLEALPMLPSCIATLLADDCHSLISIGDLCTKNRSLQKVTLTNCFKLSENKWSENVVEMLMGYLFQRLCVVNSSFNIQFPGREIPELFCHQNLGTSTNLQLPPDWCNKRCMGIAVCAVCDFAIVNSHMYMVLCLVDRNNKRCTLGSGYFWIPTGTNVDSEHILLSYHPIHFLRNGGQNPNKWCQLEVYFKLEKKKKLSAKKFGFHVVCEKDVKNWKDGCGNLGINDGSDKAAAVEDKNNTLKRKRDDYDPQHHDDAQGNASASSNDDNGPRSKRV
ncbi:TMV resistance protein N-like isoform X2 [Cornus florida]|uniref:TMV resistance protein N-like isoform X2 n=1 Tax=Cornus florida TaxID=4283 RepID=UPI00289DF4AF|nr:TMV resistance protein N-like isoform X2 [Cornus florida]